MNLFQEPSGDADFRTRLKDELIARCRKNPKYSLRAFAKALGIVPSALSDMLNGRRTITNKSIERLGLSLGLSLKEIAQFQKESADGGNKAARFQQITFDTFALISDWYHFAILELIKIENFMPTNQRIAQALGITKSEANIAIERLMRLNLVRIDSKGRWVDVSEGFTTSIKPGLTSSAARNLQKQILEQAIAAIEEVPIERRNHTSMTMAIDPADVAEASEKIKKFRRQLCKFLERNGRPKEVYQLAISLFPVSQVESHKEKTGES